MNIAWLSVLGLIVALIACFRAFLDHHIYKRRVRELHKRILDAERLLKLRGNLANEIAHEIKNPITAILCSAETLDLLIGDKIGEDHRKSLHFIKEYGDNLLRLVSDFLDVSRAEAGQIKVSPEAVPLNNVVKSILGLLESNAIRKHITLKHFSTGGELSAYVDPKHLKQILFNLAHNAIKFTPENGEVQVVISSDFPNPFIKIEVQDNGFGIPAAKLARLFDPYARYESPEAKLAAGTGLGLAVCRSMLDLAGGSITVRSTEGVGTVFEVKLPEFREKRMSQATSLLQESGHTADPCGKPLLGQNFLIVDENLGAREAVGRLIEAWGGIADKAALSIEAVEALGRKAYDAIMIDSELDGGYGAELARMIRDELRTQNTTIILATHKPPSHLQLEDSAVDRYVAKPLNGKALLNSLLNSGKYLVSH